MLQRQHTSEKANIQKDSVGILRINERKAQDDWVPV